MAAIALESSRLERRAQEAERAMVDWKIALYMAERVGSEHQGMVTGATAVGVYVRLEGLGVEGVMPAVSTGGRRALRLGDRLRVRVAAVDTFRARVILKPLSTG